ncbi:MAG TPA: hypothetical protein VEZ14_00930 [Dehalococcoidia bacterium]|nr:hypothetical protein [Dehalococcoidia bacterium]
MSADAFKLDDTGLSGIVPSGYSLVTQDSFTSGLTILTLVFHADETLSATFRSLVVEIYPHGLRPHEITVDNLDRALSSMRQAFAKPSDKVVTAKVTTIASVPAIELEVQHDDGALHQEAALHLSSGRWIVIAANQSRALVPVDVQQRAFAQLIASLTHSR